MHNSFDNVAGSRGARPNRHTRHGNGNQLNYNEESSKAILHYPVNKINIYITLLKERKAILPCKQNNYLCNPGNKIKVILTCH